MKEKRVQTPGRAPTWLLLRQRIACPSSWSPAPSSRGWLQKTCLLPQRSTLSAEGLHPPCTHNQTEVEAQLHRCSTVLDVVNHVLEIRRTPFTMADSERVSDCAVSSRSDRECQDLRVLQDEQASAPQRLPASADPSAFATLERLHHSLQLSSRAQPTSL